MVGMWVDAGSTHGRRLGATWAQGSPCQTRACQGLLPSSQKCMKQLIPPNPGSNECVDHAQEEKWPGCVFGLTSFPTSSPQFSPSCVKMETTTPAVIGKGFEIYR